MTLSISGELNAADMKRVTRASRKSAVGPTSVYYAGVTVPFITAGMAFMASSAAKSAGFSEYWTLFSAALLAAMAGISWYLIFVRLATARSVGRASDLGAEIEVNLTDDALHVKRAFVETRIEWQGIARIQKNPKHILIHVHSRAPVIIPHAWFRGNKQAKRDFIAALEERAPA